MHSACCAQQEAGPGLRDAAHPVACGCLLPQRAPPRTAPAHRRAERSDQRAGRPRAGARRVRGRGRAARDPAPGRGQPVRTPARPPGTGRHRQRGRPRRGHDGPGRHMERLRAGQQARHRAPGRAQLACVDAAKPQLPSGATSPAGSRRRLRGPLGAPSHNRRSAWSASRCLRPRKGWSGLIGRPQQRPAGQR